MYAPDETFKQEYKCTPLCTPNKLLQGHYQDKICLHLVIYTVTVENVGT